MTSITIELTGLTANLDLYVGYPDLETVQGGGTTFWLSDERDTADEIVVVEPGFTRGDLGGFEQDDYVSPGSYYVEVSAPSGLESSSFMLRVSY